MRRSAKVCQSTLSSCCHFSLRADGLASSYEAFLETCRPDGTPLVDDAAQVEPNVDPELQVYLDRLAKALPSQLTFGRHPKISAVVSRALALWQQGEKVVIFCHFRRTGQALIRHLSTAIQTGRPARKRVSA
jgi:ERCC4-related helicase